MGRSPRASPSPGSHPCTACRSPHAAMTHPPWRTCTESNRDGGILPIPGQAVPSMHLQAPPGAPSRSKSGQTGPPGHSVDGMAPGCLASLTDGATGLARQTVSVNVSPRQGSGMSGKGDGTCPRLDVEITVVEARDPNSVASSCTSPPAMLGPSRSAGQDSR